MELEVGKTYAMRNGGEITLTERDDEKGWLWGNAHGLVYSDVEPFGQYIYGPQTPHEFDITAMKGEN